MNKEIPIIAFTSGKGGCGKTTIAVNFAYSLFKADKSNRILIIDLDISNRGSTGIFSKWTQNINSSVTLTRILNNDASTEEKSDVITIDNGFYFIPASSSSEKPWEEPREYDLNNFVEGLRTKLLHWGELLEADCIVLDCFCGIDLLTTSGSACADHTIIINEPDIVTFTGSLNLKKHLDRSFEGLPRKPKVHFVINRVRSRQNVADLNTIYRDNLLKDVNNAILTYIPYNNKIFANFGAYPFFVDLLPKSLFAQKIEQIAYVLFLESHPNLIRPNVRSWTVRKFKSVYLKSIDKSAVDTEYLIVKLVSVPVLIGLLAILTLILTGFLKFTPQLAWSFVVLLLMLVLLIVVTRLLPASLVMARLHFTMARFLFRLGLKSRFKEAPIKELVKTILPFLSGIFIYTATLVLFLVIWGFASEALSIITNRKAHSSTYSLTHPLNEYVSNLKKEDIALRYKKFGSLLNKRHAYFSYYQNKVLSLSSSEKLRSTGFVYTALELPTKQLNLSNSNVTNVNFDTISYVWLNSHFIDGYDFIDKVDYSNTAFSYCKLPFDFLNSEVTSSTYNYCYFNTQATAYAEIEDQYVHARLKSSFQNIAHTASNGEYENIIINGLLLDGIFFYDCTFDDVTINLTENDFVALWDCDVKNLKIDVSNGEGNAYIFIGDTSGMNLTLGNNVKIVELANFKDQYYEEIYMKLQNIETEIDLYRSIIKNENALEDSIITDKRRSQKNLIEAYMMTYEPEFAERINELVNDLGDVIQAVGSANNGSEKPSDIGIFYLLQTYFAILNNNNYEIKEWFNKYKNWIYISDDNAIKRNLGLWEFTSWNEQMRINGEKLEPRQIDMCFLLQRMVHDDGLTKLKAEQELSKFLNENIYFDREMKIEQLTNVYYENERLSKIKRSKR